MNSLIDLQASLQLNADDQREGLGKREAVRKLERSDGDATVGVDASLGPVAGDERSVTPSALTQQLVFIFQCRERLREASAVDRAIINSLALEAAERASSWIVHDAQWTEVFLARLAPIALDTLGFVLDQSQTEVRPLERNEMNKDQGTLSGPSVSTIDRACARLVRCLPSDQATWCLPAVRRACRRWLVQSSSSQLSALVPALRDRVALEVHQVLREALTVLSGDDHRRRRHTGEENVTGLGLPETPSWRIVTQWLQARGTLVPIATVELLTETLLKRRAPEHRHEALLVLLHMAIWHPHEVDDVESIGKRLLNLGTEVFNYLQTREQLPGRRFILWADYLTAIIECFTKTLAKSAGISGASGAISETASVKALKGLHTALLHSSTGWLFRMISLHMGHELKVKVLMPLLARLLFLQEPEPAAQTMEQLLDPLMERLWPYLEVVFSAFVATHGRIHVSDPNAEHCLQSMILSDIKGAALRNRRSPQRARRIEQDAETPPAASVPNPWRDTDTTSATCTHPGQHHFPATEEDTCPWTNAMHRLMALLLTRYEALMRVARPRRDSERAMRALLGTAVRALGCALFLARHGHCRSFFPWLLPILRQSLEGSSLQAYLCWAVQWDERLLREQTEAQDVGEIMRVDRLRYQLWLIGPSVCRGAIELRQVGHLSLWCAILQRVLGWLRRPTVQSTDRGAIAPTLTIEGHNASASSSQWQLLACHFLSVLCENLEPSVMVELEYAADLATERQNWNLIVGALLRELFRFVCEEPCDRRAPFLTALARTSERLAVSEERRLYFDQARERLMQLAVQPAGSETVEAIALLLEMMAMMVDSETASILFDTVKGYLGTGTPLQIQKRAYRALFRVVDMVPRMQEVATALASTYRQSHSAAEALRLACIHQLFLQMSVVDREQVSDAKAPFIEAQTTLFYEVVFGLRAVSSRARSWARGALRLLVDARLGQEHPAPSRRLVALLLAGLLAENASSVASCLDALSLTTIRVRQALKTGKLRSSLTQAALVCDLERAFWEPLRALLHREHDSIVTNALLRAWKHGIPFLFRETPSRSTAPATEHTIMQLASVEPLVRSLGQALDRLVVHGETNARTSYEIRGVIARLVKRCPRELLESLFRSASMRAMLQSALKSLRRSQRRRQMLMRPVPSAPASSSKKTWSIDGSASDLRDRGRNRLANRTRALPAESSQLDESTASSISDPADLAEDLSGALLTQACSENDTSASIATVKDIAVPAAGGQGGRVGRSSPRRMLAARGRHRPSRAKGMDGRCSHLGERLQDPEPASLYWDDTGRLHVIATDPSDREDHDTELRQVPEASLTLDIDSGDQTRVESAGSQRRRARHAREMSAPWARFRASRARGDRPRSVYRDGQHVYVEPYAYVPLHGERRPASKRKTTDADTSSRDALRGLVRPSRERTTKIKRRRRRDQC